MLMGSKAIAIGALAVTCLVSGGEGFSVGGPLLRRANGGRASASKLPIRGRSAGLCKVSMVNTLADDVNADYAELFEANKEWIDFKLSQDPGFFKKLSSEHKPSVLWIGCADSRVPSNEIVGAMSGELFTHRNIANVVMNTDNSVMSGITYAVDVLGVEHIVVCGHTKCGGVKASLTPQNFAPPLEGWLSHIRMVYRHHRQELDSITDQDALLDRLVDLNVIEQCKNVYKSAVVQARLQEASSKPFATPRIHGCVYDIATGYLKRVNWVTPDMKDPYEMWADEGQSQRYNVQNLLTMNSKWVNSKVKNDPAYFQNLGKAHKPTIFWVGCADSRVPSNEISGTEPGQIFTHRNIANVVMQTDGNLQSGLQYAVDALEVDHIVVCGHTNCGGIAASLTPTAFSPPLEGWLHAIANVYRLHQAELDSISDQKEKLRRLVMLNVLEQCNNIAASALVQEKHRESLAAGAPYAVPRIHGFVYDLEDGRLIDLEWNPEMGDNYGKWLAAPNLNKDDAPKKKLFNRAPPGLQTKKKGLLGFFK